MQKKSLAHKILDSNEPFVFYHTHRVTEKNIHKAISENRSMDLDVSVGQDGTPYLGHSEEYYKKSSEKIEESIPLERALELLSKSTIPIIVDCKHYDAWDAVADVVKSLGQERCLVNTFTDQLKFNYTPINPDYLTEWSDISKLVRVKERYPLVTTTASAKGLPTNLSLGTHIDLLGDIRKLLIDNNIDAVSLNIPKRLFTDELIMFFTAEGVLPHINIDDVKIADLTVCYIGETDVLESASSTLI
ncbi:hypothetical protein ACFL13_03010 [Patescibacteria group bacterium]